MGVVRGNCYVTSEALYHLLGGKASGWTPHTVRHEGDVHWFLVHESGLVLDPTATQFRSPVPYALARGRGFLTRAKQARCRSHAHTRLPERTLTMYTLDDTLALCDFILDTLACEHEPTLRWRRCPEGV